jgi:hypothetical protein
VATQHLLRPSRGLVRMRDSRRADALVQIIALVGARRRDVQASAGERFRLLEERDAIAESRHLRLERRLARIEGRLRQSDRLIDQLETLRPRANPRPTNSRLHVGSVLMYVGGLVLLWLVLLVLGFALGFS